ncbi:TRAP transporter small permease [Bacillus taeanensis]|uniref:TRAP transporter small permease n=1 Tax=Bacillus taeanensis TaxID=273032 RepID=A0A366Y0Y7_9BACI|nr:TRAP transporter small permease [Bacillus taeanensis]RBW70073.1 TRAP transporter small permease [Bacillus taeanensis]
MIFIHRLSDWVYSIEKVFSIVLSSLMLISLFAGVVFRYVFNSPLIWSDETAIFSLIWLTFIGGSMGIKRQESAAVSLFMDKLKGKVKTILMAVSLLAVILFVSLILYLSIKWLSAPTILIQQSNSMKMPMIIAYLSVPVSFVFILIHSLNLFILNFRSSESEV